MPSAHVTRNKPQPYLIVRVAILSVTSKGTTHTSFIKPGVIRARRGLVTFIFAHFSSSRASKKFR